MHQEQIDKEELYSSVSKMLSAAQSKLDFTKSEDITTDKGTKKDTKQISQSTYIIASMQ